MTGAETDKSRYQVARTVNAQALSTTSAVVQQNEITAAAVAQGRWYPGPESKISTSVTSPTQSDQFGQQGAVELPAAAWGRAAVADTTNGALAIAASDAMPLSQPDGTPGAARAVTMPVMNPTMPRLRGTTAALGVNYLPSNAYGMSELGDGPNAVAHAGEAVAASMASRAAADDKAGLQGASEAAAAAAAAARPS